MKRVEVHPNFHLVGHTPTCVSVREMRPRKHTYTMGTVHLSDVSFRVQPSGLARARSEGQRNVHAWVMGNLLHEAVEAQKPSAAMRARMVQVTYHYETGRFLTVAADPGQVVDVTDGKFAAAIQVGKRLYITKEW